MHKAFAAFDDSDAVEDYELQKETEDPITFATSKDPDTLHYHEAMISSMTLELGPQMIASST